MKTVSPIALCLLLAASCEGPNPFLLGAPCAVTTTDMPQICWKDVGFDPPDCSPGFDPDFAKAIQDWGLPLTGRSPILAMSLGTDVIHADRRTLSGGDVIDGDALPEGAALEVAVAVMPADSHGWMAIGFTVDSSGVEGEALAAEIEAAYSAGELDRSIFNYVIEGSTLPPDEYTIGESHRVLAPADLGLGEGSELRALNLNVAMYHSDLDYASFFDPPRPLPDNPTLYFTLESPTAVPGSWFQTYIDGSPVPTVSPSAATILASTWDGAAGSWSTPRVYKSWKDLGLRMGTVIDGLSIDIDSSLEQILLSTRDAPAEDQMLYLLVGSDPLPRRFVFQTAPDGFLGSGGRRLGAGRGLGDFCSEDPRNRKQTTDPKRRLDDFLIARRWQEDFEGKRRLGVSGFRCKAKDGGGADVVVMRSCMEFRYRPDRPLTATAHWTYTTYDGVSLGPRSWGEIGSKKEFPAFTGRHLTVDVPLPDSVAPDGTRAVVVQWEVVDGDTRYVGPLSVLRL